MKFGVHLSTLTRCWNEDVINYLEAVKNIGYQGVELPLIDPQSFDFKRAKQELRKHGLQCTCGTGLNVNADISSLDTSVRENGIQHLKRAIDICNYLETDCLGGVLFAPWGIRLPRNKADKNYENSINALKELGDYAKEKGVYLALELLNRYETYFVNTVEEGIALVNKIGNENIKLHFDTFHAHIEEKSVSQAIEKGKGYIFHVHFCENTRGIPGTGQIDWIKVRESLINISYDRWIMIENFVMPNCEVGNDVSIWRNVENSGMDAAKQGFKFLEKLFEG